MCSTHMCFCVWPHTKHTLWQNPEVNRASEPTTKANEDHPTDGNKKNENPVDDTARYPAVTDYRECEKYEESVADQRL